MTLEGKIWKDPSSSWWLIEVSFLDVMTQGKTRKDALEMIQDAVMELLIDAYGDCLDKKFKLTTTLHENGIFSLAATNEKALCDLGIKRQKLA